MNATKNPVNDVLARPYRRLLKPDSDGGFVASIHEFPGCVAFGDSATNALQNLEAAARDWVDAALATKFPVPHPVDYDDFSGKVALRISRRLHKMAAECADREGTSINQLLSNAISHYLGQVDGLQRAAELVTHACTSIQRNNQFTVFIGSDLGDHMQRLTTKPENILVLPHMHSYRASLQKPLEVLSNV